MKTLNQRSRILLILKLLQQKSDENHPISMPEIMQHCFDHGIQAERKAIYKDIETLNQLGYEILFTRHKKQGYFCSAPYFQSAELKLLIDAVFASSFLPKKKSKELVHKLTSLTNEFEQQSLLSQCYFPENKVGNERILYNIDTLQQAILQNQAITFQYFDITVNKQKKYRKQAKRYNLIPYATIWENQRYYCIGYYQKYQNFIHYRIDKMENIKLEPNTHEKIIFDLSEYTKHFLGMYSGNKENITLKVDIDLVNEVFDQFGQEVLISEVKDSTFTVNLVLTLSPTLLSWIVQFKDKITVLSPPSLIADIKNLATSLLKNYESN